jgi:hypothetical protein
MHTHESQRVHVSLDQIVPASITALRAGAKFQEDYPGTILGEPDEKGRIPFSDMPTDRFDSTQKVFTIPMRRKSAKELTRVGQKVLKMSRIKTMLSMHGAEWEIAKTEITEPEGLFTEGKLEIYAKQIDTLRTRKFTVRRGLEGIFGHIREASPKLKRKGYNYEAVITEISNCAQRGSLDAEALKLAADMDDIVRKAREAAIKHSKWTNVRTRSRAMLSPYQENGSTKLRIGLIVRVDMEGTSEFGHKDEGRFLVETKGFTVVRQDSLRFYFENAKPKAEDMSTFGIKGMTTPAESLASQQREYKLIGLPATAKTLKNALLHAQYEGSKDNQWHEVTPIADGPDAGTMKYAIGTDQSFASQNAKEILGILARLKAYGLVPSKNTIDGRFNDSDQQAQNNAYFSAGLFGHPTIHTGRGTGGTSGLVFDISDDNDVVRHEAHHMVQWLVVPGGDYPADLHEGGADVGAKLTLLEIMAEDGELEAAGADFIRNNRWQIGNYAAGDLQDKQGKKRGELRNLRDIISVNIQTNDPHQKGRASGGSEMRHYEHYMIGREGVSISQGLKDSRACYMYLRKSSKGGSTKAEDLLRSALAFDRKNFNGANVEQIKHAYALSDIKVNELDSAEKTRTHIVMLVAARKQAA